MLSSVVSPSLLQFAAALAAYPALRSLLGWPLAAALTLLWLSAAEGGARRNALRDARRTWEVRRLRSRLRPSRLPLTSAPAGGARRAGAAAARGALRWRVPGVAEHAA